MTRKQFCQKIREILWQHSQGVLNYGETMAQILTVNAQLLEETYQEELQLVP